ncbi:MAG: LysR family transcriptional regulator [Betaproteobacteria bacterium]|nr:MAG: LysR family transcriptional regulator [Betaproteobacteria bacterium]
MDLKSIDWFVRIAETGSLSRAALDLDVSPSMLSRGIRDLERRVGQPLFQRTGRGMQPTEFGWRLLPLARRATLEFRRFNDEANALRGRLSGTVAIGLPGSVAARVVAPLVRLAVEKMPDVSLRFVESLSGGIEERLATRRIDIGLAFEHESRVTRAMVPLASSSLYLIGPAGDPLTARSSVPLSRLATCGVMLPGRPHSVRTMVEDVCAERGIALKVLFEIESLLAIRETVAAGCGHTIAGFSSVAREVAAGLLQATPLRDPTINRVLVMTTGPRNAVTSAARAVSELILRVAGELVANGTWRAPSGATTQSAR